MTGQNLKGGPNRRQQEVSEYSDNRSNNQIGSEMLNKRNDIYQSHGQLPFANEADQSPVPALEND